MKKIISLAAAAVAGVALLATLSVTAVGAAGSGGVTGPAFYVDGQLYRTVVTPTDFSRTRAPEHSFDIIYDFGGLQRNVAEAAPGDRDYNGGRWRVHALSFSDYAGALADDSVDMNQNDVLDSAEEVLAAIAGGYATDTGVVATFVCPVIPVPGHGAA
jgi:hypothetical protein